jgi:hypothetical protein
VSGYPLPPVFASDKYPGSPCRCMRVIDGYPFWVEYCASTTMYADLKLMPDKNPIKTADIIPVKSTIRKSTRMIPIRALTADSLLSKRKLFNNSWINVII